MIIFCFVPPHSETGNKEWCLVTSGLEWLLKSQRSCHRICLALALPAGSRHAQACLREQRRQKDLTDCLCLLDLPAAQSNFSWRLAVLLPEVGPAGQLAQGLLQSSPGKEAPPALWLQQFSCSHVQPPLGWKIPSPHFLVQLFCLLVKQLKQNKNFQNTHWS